MRASYEAPYYADFSSLPSISLSVRDQISYPFKATGKIMISYILILKFLERRREYRRLNRMVASIPGI
jgi:hypothetical protein